MDKIKIGIIGLGARGYSMLRDNILKFGDVDVSAVCDLYPDRVERAILAVKDAGGDAKGYASYLDLLEQATPDAVIVMTSWEYHVEVAVAAMKHGIPVAVEVGGAYSLEDCYTLVRTQEETHTPFMFMENCCFNKDELLATSMARKGLFGEIVYCEGAYGHDLREEIVYGKENRHYRLNNYLNRNCENYPTHELLPIMRLLHINRGNRMLSLVSVASKARGLEQYIEKHQDKVDPSLRNAKFAQGDVVDTIITCAHGETIHLRLDTTLPRFYDRGFTVRGTKGMYMQTINAVLLDGEETHEFEPAKSVKRLLNSAEKYEKEFLPPCWRDITPEEIAAGHGGMDSVELRTFFDAVKNKSPMPIDVYDCAAVTCVSALSEASIAMGGAPVAIPDFTGGKWVLRQPEDVMPL